MAFDMYFGDRREKVDFEEEYIFVLAESESSEYPQLNFIWANFYSSFVLSSEQAGALVHELLSLYAANASATEKAFGALVLRLAAFFSAVFRAGGHVRCVGD